MTRRAKLLITVAAVLVAGAVFFATIYTIQFVSSRNQLARRFDDCTLPGPNPPPNTGHACYDHGQQQLAGAIGQIELRQGCLAAASHNLPDPPPCAATDRQLRDGGFLPTTTTVAP